jgi:hypothetical protein
MRNSDDHHLARRGTGGPARPRATGDAQLGLLADWPYAHETANWRLQAQGQDVGNLLAVVVLLVAVVAARRGSRRGLQVWAGTLLYLAYAFALYALTIHFGPLFLPWVAGLGLCVHSLGSVSRVGVGEWSSSPRGARPAAVVLGVVSSLFALLWLGNIVGALARGEVPAELLAAGLPANPVHVLDLALVLPAMLMTAVGAGRGRSAAQLRLVPWLVFATLMGASIVAGMVLGAAPAAVLAAVGVVTLGSAMGAVLALGGSRHRSTQ